MPVTACENYFTTMLLSNTEDKLVTFYSAFTCIYFPIVISLLYFTDHWYNVGKYSFFPVIGLILVTECSKFLIGTLHVAKQYAVGGRVDEKYIIGSAKKNATKNKIKECMKCCMIMVVMVAIYFIVAVLFGAEIFSKHEETFMLSVLMCVLTVFPACLNLGAGSVMNLLLGHKLPNDALWMSLLRNVQITLFGAWLGAFVIPLDWDRPWQEWPIPCSTGAMLGFTGANLLMLINMVPKMVRKNVSTKTNRKQR